MECTSLVTMQLAREGVCLERTGWSIYCMSLRKVCQNDCRATHDSPKCSEITLLYLTVDKEASPRSYYISVYIRGTSAKESPSFATHHQSDHFLQQESLQHPNTGVPTTPSLTESATTSGSASGTTPTRLYKTRSRHTYLDDA